jgi:hypothetical protein|tara:strand:+ start:46 stop:495 length:450 start_codon:yes stop_codon:yes gene_type:complete
MEIKILYEDINGYGGKNGVKVYEQLLTIIKNVDVKFTDDSKSFREEFREDLRSKGFPSEVQLSPDHRITITTMKENIGICLQLGNIARAPYDLLKLSYFYNHDNSFQGIIICPIDPDANKAYFERVISELKDLFKDVIQLPIRVIGIGY